MKKRIFSSLILILAVVYTSNAQTPDSTQRVKMKPKIKPTTMVEVKPQTINHPSDTTQQQNKISVNEEGVSPKKKREKKKSDKK